MPFRCFSVAAVAGPAAEPALVLCGFCCMGPFYQGSTKKASCSHFGRVTSIFSTCCAVGISNCELCKPSVKWPLIVLFLKEERINQSQGGAGECSEHWGHCSLWAAAGDQSCGKWWGDYEVLQLNAPVRVTVNTSVRLAENNTCWRDVHCKLGSIGQLAEHPTKVKSKNQSKTPGMFQLWRD